MTRASQGNRRLGKWWAVLTVILMIVSVVCTWLLSAHFQSPAQRAAKAAPPPPAAITAQVREGSLKDSISGRATVAPGRALAIPLSAVQGNVVTGLPMREGERVTSGSVVLETNGRPLIVIQGEFPMYRDLSVGDSGPDVMQWQEFLADQGFLSDSAPGGKFGKLTYEATLSFYRSKGYALSAGDALTSDTKQENASSPGSAVESSPQADDPQGNGEATEGAAPKGDATDEEASDSGVPVVPRSEIVTLKDASGALRVLPAVGDTIGEKSRLEASTGAPELSTEIPTLESLSLREGMKVTVTFPDGKTGDGTLGEIPKPSQPTGDDQNPDVVSVPINMSTSIPSNLVGESLLIEIVKESVSENSLIVPTRAVSHVGDRNQIAVENGRGAFRMCEVTVLGETKGESAIKPSGDCQVTSSNLVKVG